MDFESIELSIEDVLDLHREWITQLFVDDEKTDLEIILLLYQRGFLVSRPQLRRCFREWGLGHHHISTLPALMPEVSLEESWEWVSSQNSRTLSQLSSNARDPEMVDVYSRKKLPPIPIIRKGEMKPAIGTYHLKVNWYHGPLASQVHQIDITLSDVPDEPPHLQTFVGEEHRHEILALGLYSDTPLPSSPRYRRAGLPREDTSKPWEDPEPRSRQETLPRKRK